MIRSFSSHFSRYLKSVSFLSAVKLSSFIKMSYVFGSFAAFFSLSNCLIPLAGAFGGVTGSISLCIALSILRWIVAGSFSWHILAFYIPGLCASLYWTRNHWFMRAFMPALCMFLFLIHPVGIKAGLYSCFWLIPFIIYFSGSSSILALSYGSTFVAHAVGSIIWIYTMPLTPAAWLGLIPVVVFERSVFALGMASAHAVLSYGIRLPFSTHIKCKTEHSV